MYRQVAAIVLFFAFAVQVFNRNILVLDYYANQAAFAKVCVNKAKPVLKCKGKCQLMKKLAEEEKKEEDSPLHKAENKAQVAFPVPVLAPAIVSVQAIEPSYNAFPESSFPQGIPADIFHPPALI